MASRNENLVLEPVRRIVDNLASELSDLDAELSIPTGGFVYPAMLMTTSESTEIEFDSSKLMDEVTEIVTKAIKDKLKSLLDEKLVEYGMVETGALKNSLSISIESGQIKIDYSAPYAGLLHEGGYITPYGNNSAEKVFIPGRPWINDVLSEFDYQQVADEALAGYVFKG